MDAETFERITAAKAKEKGSERIQLLDEDAVVPPPTSISGDTREEKSNRKGKNRKTDGLVDDGKLVSMMLDRVDKPLTPKHEFEVLSSTETDVRKRFIMTISLPDEASTVRDHDFLYMLILFPLVANINRTRHFRCHSFADARPP